MTRDLRIQTTYALLLGALLSASVWLVRAIDRERADEPIQEVLYIPSPKVVKRLSLGYSGLLADIYWTRAVQYFGTKHKAKAKQYMILEPLLDMTTTLDPQLIPAYEFGSVFLAQRPPEGAGDPQAAARLVEKGIRENPDAWRLYYELGYVYWIELKDPAKASETFERGSRVAGAHPWMRVMAAALAAHAGETETATYMWTNILHSTEDKDLRANAINRLRCLRVDSEVKLLQSRVDQYSAQNGRFPSEWQDLIAAGLLRGVPLDPKNYRYDLVAGRVQVEHPDLFPFITQGLPPGQAPKDVPGESAFKAKAIQNQ
jgi:tetratricopeptide (TPR) repeat protein